MIYKQQTLITMIFKRLTRLWRNYKIQTFTYYIPAPPQRNAGYREKQFDRLFYNFINQGYEIISFQTTPHNGVEQSGMWISCLVRATNKAAAKLDFKDIVPQDLELDLTSE